MATSATTEAKPALTEDEEDLLDKLREIYAERLTTKASMSKVELSTLAFIAEKIDELEIRSPHTVWH